MSQTTTTTMASKELPHAMRAWQWTMCSSVLERAIQLNENAPLPTDTRPLGIGESLIQVYAAALNPVDYKLAELPLVGRLAIPKPATPGLDFAGIVARVGPECNLQIGQRVFGKLEPKQQFGTLAQYIIGSRAGTVPLPDGVTFEQGATLGVCGLVTYQCLVRNVKPDDHVLINGGSGGTGSFAIQIAKALGCHVTTTCSGANVQLCKDLGADTVIDYRTTNVAKVLSTSEKRYDFVLDNVGEPAELYWKSPHYTKDGTKYVQIGSQVSLSFVYDLAFRFLVPTWLGGGQRPFSFGLASTNYEDFTNLVRLVADQGVKPLIDEVLAFKDVPKAYGKLKLGRAKGKIVIQVQELVQ